MLQTVINPLLISFTLFTTFGVLVHDTQVDRAATLALAIPAATIVSYAAVDTASKSGDSHVHVERFSSARQLADIRSNVPRLQPRDDDVRFFQTKKQFGSDPTTLWPSV
jgi:hypothetical protein